MIPQMAISQKLQKTSTLLTRVLTLLTMEILAVK